MYLVALQLKGQRCLVIGGGRVAYRKVMGLLQEDAQVVVISPVLGAALQALVAEQQVSWQPRVYQSGDLTAAFLVFAATDCLRTQDKIQAEAQVRRCLFNRVDDADRCQFHVPATFQQGDIQLGVTTNGQSPALARLIRDQLAAKLTPGYPILLHLLAQLRADQQIRALPDDEKRTFFNALLAADLLAWLEKGEQARFAAHLHTLLGFNPKVDFGHPGTWL